MIKGVYIEWCDAIEKEYGWSSEDEVKEWAKTNDWIIKQFGYIVEETTEHIVLATRLSPNEDGETMYGGVIKIPKTWIKKRVELNIEDNG